MISNRDVADSHKLVTFYSIYSGIYFSIVLVTLYCSAGIYSVGKYNFHSVLTIIAFAEITKYFVGVVYLKKSAINLTRKHDNVTLSSFVKSFLNKGKVREGCKTVFTVFLMTIIYFVISVLYGAEITGKSEETFMFSALLSVLTIFPICINLGSPYVISLLTGYRPTDKLEYLLFQNVYLTCFGAWLGAFVIPLDWDRPWQQWPIPCSVGAMLGFLVSHFFMAVHGAFEPVRKKMKF